MQVLQYGYPRSANRFDSLKLSRCGQVPRGQDKGGLSMRRRFLEIREHFPPAGNQISRNLPLFHVAVSRPARQADGVVSVSCESREI